MHQRLRLLLATSAILAAGAVHAQEEDMINLPPDYKPQGFYSTKQDPNAPQKDIYSTHERARPTEQPQQSLPWQNQTFTPNPEDMQIPVRAPSQPKQNYPQGYMPFGKAAPEATVHVPEGPHDVTAVPVQNVGVSSDELEPATAAQPVKLPPKDPTEPTAQTAPIFEADDASVVKNVVLRGLNKVTAQVSTIEGPTGAVLGFGNLEIIAKSCRKSSKMSMPDYAALLEIRERKANEEPKLLFSGWMYASSPSVMALEHPVYDISVVECKAGKGDLPEPAPKEEPKKPQATPPKKK